MRDRLNKTTGFVKITMAALTISAGSLMAMQAQARDQINIVGSSTVFPFSTAVAENFGRNTNFKAPVVESTGSGGGLKLFCAGAGVNTPDITNASRRIKASEVKNCAANGVDEIVEMKVGYDGIVFGNAHAGATLDLSKEQIFLALAKMVPDGKGGLIENPNMTWSDVDPSLPNIKIEVMGPPPTSGTRDAFVELVMEEAAENFPAIANLPKDQFKAAAHGIREDGGYIEAGENDNLIVNKLVSNPDSFGIFGFSFLDQNLDQIKGAKIGGVEPTFENISSGDYGVSRALFVYIKKSHIGVIPGIEEFLAEFTSEGTWGPDGYLADKGLIPMGDDERQSFANDVANLTPMN